MEVYQAGPVGLELAAGLTTRLAVTLIQETVIQLCKCHPLRDRLLPRSLVPMFLLDSALCINHFYFLYCGCFDILGFC